MTLVKDRLLVFSLLTVFIVAVGAIVAMVNPLQLRLPHDTLTGQAYVEGTVPMGFAPPWNPYDGKGFLTVTTDDANASALRITVEASHDGMIFYKRLYRYDNVENWTPVEFPQDDIDGWIKDEASVTFDVDSARLDPESWVVVYACADVDDAWRCGCFSKYDGVCRKWSIQNFTGTVPPPTRCVADADCDDGNACTTNTCADGVCEFSAVPDGTACEGGTCQSGVCVVPADCASAFNGPSDGGCAAVTDSSFTATWTPPSTSSSNASSDRQLLRVSTVLHDVKTGCIASSDCVVKEDDLSMDTDAYPVDGLAAGTLYHVRAVALCNNEDGTPKWRDAIWNCTTTGLAACTDADGDGYNVTGENCGPADCDDTDPAVHPGAAEVCDNGKDDDCDGDVDSDDSDCTSGDDHALLATFLADNGLTSSQVTAQFDADGHLYELKVFYRGADDWSTISQMTHLQILALGANQFSGSLPAWLGQLSNLQFLDLGDNQFSGSLPAWLGGLSKLQVLSLGDNQFSGSLPAWLGGLSKLHYLSLENNQFSGSLPASLGGLSNLQYLYLENNAFSGVAPATLNTIIPNLHFGDLSNNCLVISQIQAACTAASTAKKFVVCTPQKTSC